MPIIKSKTTSDTVVHSDGFRAYDGLVNYGLKKHLGSATPTMNLPLDAITSTELRTFGDCAKYDFQSSEEYINITFICT